MTVNSYEDAIDLLEAAASDTSMPSANLLLKAVVDNGKETELDDYMSGIFPHGGDEDEIAQRFNDNAEEIAHALNIELYP